MSLPLSGQPHPADGQRPADITIKHTGLFDEQGREVIIYRDERPVVQPAPRITVPNTGDGGLLGNPHCAGSSDNVNLPSGHVNNFPGCK